MTSSKITATLGETIRVVVGNPGDTNGAKIVQARVLGMHDNGHSQLLTCGNGEGFMYHVRQLENYDNLYYCTSGFPWNEKYYDDIERLAGFQVTTWMEYDWSEYEVLAKNIISHDALDDLISPIT
jgi:hypothetical protein